MFDKVLEFRTKLNLPVSKVPSILRPEDSSFYVRFMMEEISEFMRAHERRDLVDAADAIGDLIYVALGCAHHMGIPFNSIFAAIHEANMMKEPGITRRGIEQDAVKPDGWVGPEIKIAKIIENVYFIKSVV